MATTYDVLTDLAGGYDGPETADWTEEDWEREAAEIQYELDRDLDAMYTTDRHDGGWRDDPPSFDDVPW